MVSLKSLFIVPSSYIIESHAIMHTEGLLGQHSLARLVPMQLLPLQNFVYSADFSASAATAGSASFVSAGAALLSACGSASEEVQRVCDDISHI